MTSAQSQYQSLEQAIEHPKLKESSNKTNSRLRTTMLGVTAGDNADTVRGVVHIQDCFSFQETEGSNEMSVRTRGTLIHPANGIQTLHEPLS